MAGNQKAASEMMDLMMPKGFKTSKKKGGESEDEGKPRKEKKTKKEQARVDMFRLHFLAMHVKV